MSDTSISIVILSERSLPAVAGDAKDLYLPRLPRLPTEPRGLRGRPLWSAAVRAALHSCRLSMPLGHSGSGVAASVRRSPFAMTDNLTTIVILSEQGERRISTFRDSLAFRPNRDSQAGVSFPYSLFVMSKEASS